MMKDLEGTIYEEWLSSFGFFSLEKGRQRSDLITAYSFLMVGVEGQTLISSST